MTVLDLLIKASASLADLKALLLRVKEQLPDLAPQIDPILAALETGVDPASLAHLAVSVVQELAAVAKGHLEPTKHAGDAT